MKRAWRSLAAMLMLMPAVGSAELTLSSQVMEAGESRVALIAVEARKQEQASQEADDLLSETLLAAGQLIEERLSQEKALQLLARAQARGGRVIEQEAFVYQDEKTASVAVVWQGEQPDGMQGCTVRTLSLDLSTGEEILFDQLFSQPDEAARQMEEIIEWEVLSSMSDYMMYADLLPMPRDNFSFDENGLTVYYPDDRYQYFDGMSGAVHFAWYELAAFIGEESPVYALARAKEEETLEEQMRLGAFGGVMPFALGERLGNALESLTLLADPDYTREAKVYLFEEAYLRGWALEIRRYAETDEEDTPISAVRSSRVSWHGLTVGETTKEEIIGRLGPAQKTRQLDESSAQDEMLEPGESLYYALGGHVLQAHVDEQGVLSCLIMRDSMPEENLY